MPELRPLLERARDSIPPPLDGFRRLSDRRRHRRRNQRLGAAAVALVVAGTGLALAARAFMSPEGRLAETPGTSARTGPVNPQITARIEVGQHALGLAVGEGAIWAVTQPNEEPRELVRIDPVTNTVVAREEYIGDPVEFAAGAGSVWAVRTADGPDELLRINPTSLQITARVSVGDHAGPIAAGPEGVWLVVREEAQAPSLARVDPGTGEFISELPLDGLADFVIGLELADGSVWLRGWEDPDHARGCARVIRIDPAANAIVQDLTVQGPVQSGGGGLRFASGDSAVWVNCREEREQLFAVGIDTETGQMGPPLTLPHGVFWPIGASADGAWFAGFEADERPLLVLLAPLTGEIRGTMEPETLFVESAVYDPATDTIWIPDSRGSADAVLRIDVRP